MTSAPRLSVVIPTFRRPELLRPAVLSCLWQQGVPPEQMEIVVVDNAPEASARETIDALRASEAAPVPLLYVHEPRPGISRARNAGIAHASGMLLAFLDDDEEADPLWLKSLADCLDASGADAVLGPVRFRFDTTAPADIEFLQWCYGREWHGKSGETVSDIAGMGNCMIRKDRCEGDPPFDPALGLTGGEDLRFIVELRERGGRVVWCEEARVTEYCPPARAKLSYILRRSMRRGQLYVRGFTWRRSGTVSKVATQMMIGAGQFVILGPAGLLLWYIARNAARRCLVKAALGAGKVTWPSFLTLKGYGAS
jgi:succinoglycan biosynthesis protein ExoM